MHNPDMPVEAQDLEQIFGRALVAAHLMIGNLDLAEQAALKAIEHWNRDEGSEDEVLMMS